MNIARNIVSKKKSCPKGEAPRAPAKIRSLVASGTRFLLKLRFNTQLAHAPLVKALFCFRSPLCGRRRSIASSDIIAARNAQLTDSLPPNRRDGNAPPENSARRGASRRPLAAPMALFRIALLWIALAQGAALFAGGTPEESAEDEDFDHAVSDILEEKDTLRPAIEEVEPSGRLSFFPFSDDIEVIPIDLAVEEEEIPVEAKPSRESYPFAIVSLRQLNPAPAENSGSFRANAGCRVNNDFLARSPDTRQDGNTLVARIAAPGTGKLNHADLYSIVLPRIGNLVVETEGTTDTYGYLIDKNGDELQRNDDDGKRGNFRIVQTLDAGQYYIQAETFRGETPGPYELVVSFSSDVGDSIDTAYYLPENTTFHGSLVNEIDRDYFRVDMPKEGIAVFESEGTAIVGAIFDDKGNRLGVDHFFPLQHYLNAGVYYLRIRGEFERGTFSIANGKYRIQARRLPTQQIELNRLFEDTIEFDQYQRLYSIDVPQTGTLSIQTDGALDTFGVLCDRRGNSLAYNNDSERNHNFLIDQFVRPGVYYLRMSGSSPHLLGNYSILARFLPDPGATFTTASDVPEDGRIYSEIRPERDVDMYRFEATTGGFIAVEVVGNRTLDTTIVDSNGSNVGLSVNRNYRLNHDSNSEPPATHISRFVPKGTYYIVFRGDTSGLFRGEYKANARLVEPQILDDNKLLTATLYPPNDVDFYFIDQGILVRETTGNTNIILRYWDAFGDVVDPANLLDAPYYLQVEGLTSKTVGEYQLTTQSADQRRAQTQSTGLGPRQ